ncbi:MAG: alpha/beta fold hydrolase [Myxococcales bacterium]|nr:alpha/beta fold hydrolase [Myxococcales bacterium]
MAKLDAAVGVVASLVHQARRRPENTRLDARLYCDVPAARAFPKPPVPTVRIIPRRPFGAVARELLVFESSFEPLEPRFRARYRRDYRPLHTVYARRLRPPGVARRPRLVYLHGYMQPETVIEEVGLLAHMAARLGVEVIHLQVPYHGRRRGSLSRLSGALYWTSDIVRSVEALRQTLEDARALIAWLRAEDPRPIGVAGVSMGGVHALALACLEPQLAFAAPCVAHMDIAAMTEDAPVLATMRRRLREDGWAPGALRRGVEASAWSRLELAIPSSRVQLFAAARDAFFRPELVESMWRRLGEPEIHWYPTSHIGFIPRLPLAFRQMRRFIDARVGSS